MATIDELKILITGDTAGIESTMKRALSIMQGGVKNMNSQEVDWTSIFTRSVSPAIISGVASIFAYAISQAVNFQTAMATTGTAAGESASQIGQMSQSALNLSTQVPASAQDIANAMAKVSAIFSNVSDQQAVVTAMAELQTAGFGSLADITKAAIPIFQQFGVTTTDQAVNVLTSLMHSAEAAKESIPELASQFTSFSNQLPGADKNLNSFNNLISTFGAEIQNLGAQGAQDIFAALASSSHNAAGPMEILGQSFGSIQKSLLTDGGLSAIAAASKALQRMGPDAALVATNFGLTAEQVGMFQTNADKLPKVSEDAKAIATNTQSIYQAFQQADVGTNQLLTDWNKINAAAIDMGKNFTPLLTLLGSIFATGAQDADAFFKDVTDGFASMLSVFYGNNLKDAVTGLFKGVGNAFKDDVTTPLQQAFNGIVSIATGSTSLNTLNSSLKGSGVGFTSDMLSRIDKQASESGLVDSLVSALHTGGKGSQYAGTIATFNLTLPQSAAGWSPKDLAAALYSKFQGTSQ